MGCFCGSEASQLYTRIFASTKNLSFIELFATRVPGSRLLELFGVLEKILLQGTLISLLLSHLLPQHLSYKAGNTRILFRSTNPRPTGDFLIQYDSDILHDTTAV